MTDDKHVIIEGATCTQLPPKFRLSNQTRATVEIDVCGGTLALAPLEDDCEVEATSLTPAAESWLRKLELRQYVRIDKVADAKAGRAQDEQARAAREAREARNQLPRAQVALVCAVVLVALLVPGLALYYGTALDRYVGFRGLRPRLVDPDPSVHVILVTRALQLLLITLATLLPGAMFLQFDRERLKTTRKRMLHDVFRLDRRLFTLADMKARYGSQLGDLIGGRDRTDTETRRGASRCSPVVFATAAIALGWVLILLDLGGEQVGASPRNVLQSLFTPDGSAFSYAFLGTYFFSIQVVLRGYVRGDLTPKTYNAVTVRIFVAMILAWLLGGVTGRGDPATSVLAFLAGVVPETVLRLLWDRVRLRRTKVLDERRPLQHLEGIDLYDRTRLADEGITNIQALAHHNLVELMLNTRIPAPRLVDWVDQAVLYLHVVEPERPGATPPAPKARDRYELLMRLRRYGVRTATDLIHAAAYAHKRDGEAGRRRLLQTMAGDEAAAVGRLEVALAVLADDEWVSCVVGWRKPGSGERVAPERARLAVVPAARSLAAVGDDQATVIVPVMP